MTGFLKNALRRVQHGWAVSDGYMVCVNTLGCCCMAVLVGVTWALLPVRPLWVALKVLYTLAALVACCHAIAMTPPDRRCQGGR